MDLTFLCIDTDLIDLTPKYSWWILYYLTPLGGTRDQTERVKWSAHTLQSVRWRRMNVQLSVIIWDELHLIDWKKQSAKGVTVGWNDAFKGTREVGFFVDAPILFSRVVQGPTRCWKHKTHKLPLGFFLLLSFFLLRLQDKNGNQQTPISTATVSMVHSVPELMVSSEVSGVMQVHAGPGRPYVHRR